jgi:hypothetical protein
MKILNIIGLSMNLLGIIILSISFIPAPMKYFTIREKESDKPKPALVLRYNNRFLWWFAWILIIFGNVLQIYVNTID